MLTRRPHSSTPAPSHRVPEFLRTHTPHIHLSSLPRISDAPVRIPAHDLAYLLLAADIGLSLLQAETAIEVHEVHRRVNAFKSCPNGSLFTPQTAFIVSNIDATIFSRVPH